KACRLSAPKSWPLRSKARWAFWAAENLRLADHIGLPSTSFTGSCRWSTRGLSEAGEGESYEVAGAFSATCDPGVGLAATAEGPLSQAARTRAAAAANRSDFVADIPSSSS